MKPLDWLLAAFLLAAFAVNVVVVRAMFRAYSEEREHAEFLFDCTHAQRPEACENVWLSQYASTEPPWEPTPSKVARR